MQAITSPWTLCFCRHERVKGGSYRRLSLARRVCLLPYDDDRRLLVMQPAFDPALGKVGPEHTRTRIEVCIPVDLSSSQSWTSAATVTLEDEDRFAARVLLVSVKVYYKRMSDGYELLLEPTRETSDRAANFARLAILMPEGIDA